MEKDPTGQDEEMSIWFKLNHVLKLGKQLNPLRESIRITMSYIFFGVLWILLSDKILEFMVTDKETMTAISMVKGWAFVIATGFVIFTLTYISFAKTNKTEQQLLQSYEELTTLHEELAASEQELRVQLAQIQGYQEELHILAYFDPLTGLPGRLSMEEAITKLLIKNIGKKCFIVYMDLDNFKMVNDTKGHTFGDEILKTIAEKLKGLQQQYTNISFYRLYGDEFIASIDGITENGVLEVWMKLISEAVETTVSVGSTTIKVTASIGIAVYPEHGDNIDELKRCADIAMFQSKNSGRNRYTVYTQELDEVFEKRRNIEEQLKMALGNDEFEVYYQPQVELNTFKIKGLEALIRWRNKKLGYVPPDKFINIAEETHLIIDIGEWVLREACLLTKSLHEQGYSDLQISINVSLIQLLQDNFLDKVQEILLSTGLDARYIELEITESTLIQSFDLVITKLNQLRALGFNIALDDFGTGYSSLNYLNLLPITTLKIDKVFIDNIFIDKKTEKLTGLVVDIGKQLELTVVAEGVEEEEQLSYLVNKNCDKFQGYLYSKPLPKVDIICLLQDERLERKNRIEL